MEGMPDKIDMLMISFDIPESVDISQISKIVSVDDLDKSCINDFKSDKFCTFEV